MPRLVHLTGRHNKIEAYAFGFRQPVFQYELAVQAEAAADLGALDALMGSALETSMPAMAAASPSDLVERLMAWTTVLLQRARHPVLEPARLLKRQSGTPAVFVVAQPCLHPAATQEVVLNLISLINKASQPLQAPDCLNSTVTDSLSQLTRSIEKHGFNGFNTGHFVAAAAELGLPWRRLRGQLVQLGHGANARWLESSWTDRTPVIASGLARNKQAAAALLRMNGLPVPDHHLAESATQALRQADALGYPVVIKPVDRDGGEGVRAGLADASAVRAAFDEAARLSKRVLVEKHVPGRDYRLQVVDGEVQGVLERVPGGVVGNGRDSVRILLEQQNHERRTALDDRRYLHAMDLDDEAMKLLAAQGLTGESVPAEGQGVRLRSASNVASGGVPVELSLDQVHADNLRLAERAARVLRLDVAGVDLLAPDIGRSWLETGANICEVNAMPQMFTTMHKPMLRSLFKGGNGRIPVLIVIEAARPDLQVAGSIHQWLSRCGQVAGMARGGEMWVGADRVATGLASSLVGARMLLLDPAVQALVVAFDGEQAPQASWPVDVCDVLVLHGALPDTGGRSQWQNWLSLAQFLKPRQVLVNVDNADCRRSAAAVFGPSTPVQGVHWQSATDLSEVAHRAVEALIGATSV
ncbi:MAG: acetate--CoA ligase family protein [Betaproteobacteria bacterium]|nr:acetate--CoA ligase family protein [Betaproteobacteria bacterium]